MKVIYSWCKSEGRPALVGEKVPLADLRETHGICDFHFQQMGADRESSVLCNDDSSCRIIHRSSFAGGTSPLSPAMNDLPRSSTSPAPLLAPNMLRTKNVNHRHIVTFGGRNDSQAPHIKSLSR